ncbi:MAG: penicillin-binding transpeptidase domain-containing protein [Bifidobacteriaceae bacterium]|nr:penicillin-binding transpeptidase domain-containing protein [Bifidobacteriaceae bacterium]
MNKSLRHVFYVIIVLFVLLGLSSSMIQAVFAARLNADPRNSRTLYAQFSRPRGAILASDGTVLANSDASNDAFMYQRKYSNGQLYAPVTGFYSVTVDADRGIEASRNSLLSGSSNQLWWTRLKNLFTGTEDAGATIQTSIDPKLQETAYQALLDKNYEGAVIAIEPKTGRILAMVSTPSYDPNQLATHDTNAANTAYQQLVQGTGNPMLNKTISELYPPGSTFKIVVSAAALESGNYDTTTEIDAGSSYTLPGTNTQLTNANSHGNGTNGKITLEDAFAYSSNTAFAQLGVALGAQTVSNMATSLGFGSTITVDSGGSGDTSMKAVASAFPSDVSDDRLALQSIGQGDTTETVLQDAMIAATVANGGKEMQPTIVDRVQSQDLTTISETTPTVLNTAFSEDTANKLTGMMEAMVEKEYPALKIDTTTKIAAKTGTAQNGEGQIDAWITGFAPADDPKIAVAVVVHNVNTYGAIAAGPIMHAVLKEALQG